jgi:hypothetical protein
MQELRDYMRDIESTLLQLFSLMLIIELMVAIMVHTVREHWLKRKRDNHPKAPST